MHTARTRYIEGYKVVVKGITYVVDTCYLGHYVKGALVAVDVVDWDAYRVQLDGSMVREQLGPLDLGISFSDLEAYGREAYGREAYGREAYGREAYGPLFALGDTSESGNGNDGGSNPKGA